MENKFINIISLSKKKFVYKQIFIDRLIYQNNSENADIESINKLRILILINIFNLENDPKYSCIKLSLLFLESSDPDLNNIYNSFENILWVIKQSKSSMGKIYIPTFQIYKLFNFIEWKYINYFKNKEKDNFNLFFIGGYPS